MKIITKSAEVTVIEPEVAVIGRRANIKEMTASLREVTLITTQLRILQL
jgi:hypothetical protein